jgi:acyl carrier protein
VVSDLADEIRDILVFHLGCGEERLTDAAKLTADLGADSLDIVEIMMSCEERFCINIPNQVASSLVTVGDTVEWITAYIAMSADTGPARQPFGLGPGADTLAVLRASKAGRGALESDSSVRTARPIVRSSRRL